MEIVGLSGYARSGKDAAAAVLVEEFGFTRVAFADKLREVLYALNPIVVGTATWSDDVFYTNDARSLRDVIQVWGWDHYKDSPYGPEIRRLLQRLGTEAGRETLWDSIWIDAALTGLPEDAKVVVSDARFFNEFDALIGRGGYIWRINRDGVGPANDHASETEAVLYDKFSLFLENNGSLEKFKELVRKEYTSGHYKEWSYS